MISNMWIKCYNSFT